MQEMDDGDVVECIDAQMNGVERNATLFVAPGLGPNLNVRKLRRPGCL